MSKQTDLINVTDAITVDSSNNVGIGTSSPSALLTVEDSSPIIEIKDTASSTYTQLANVSGDTYIGGDRAGVGGKSIIFRHTGVSEAMRITAGNLLVGKTSGGVATVGHEINGNNGYASHTRSGSTCLYLNRTTSDGDIAVFRKDGSNVGAIGVVSGDVYMQGPTNHSGIQFNTNGILPLRNNAIIDNTLDLGGASYRWDDVYATNGTIQTSDRNEKQDIEALSDAEQRVAVACKGLLRKFRWKDAVAEKGDDARIHFGIIAQDLQDAFAAEGLDAGRYAMFISSTWWETQTDVPAVVAVDEVLDEDDNVVTEAVEAKDAYTRTDTYETLEEAPEGATERTRLGVRYPELLAFIIGAM